MTPPRTSFPRTIATRRHRLRAAIRACLTSAGAVAAGLTLLTTLTQPLEARQSQGGGYPKLRAKNAGAPTEFPNAQVYSFEAGAGGSAGGGVTFLGPWTFQPGAGVVLDSEVDPDAPHGGRAARVSGGSSFAASATLAPGPLNTNIWRVRFKAVQQDTFDPPSLEVILDGVLVTKVTPGATYADYVSRPVEIPSGSAELQFAISGASSQAALVDEVMVEPVARWSSAATWEEWTGTGWTDSSSAPTEWNAVVIRSDEVVALDGTCYAKKVDVRGELLAGNVDCSLKTRYVLADGEDARFEVGTEGAPFQEDFTLMLKGNDPEADDLGDPEDPDDNNTKALMARMGGQLDLHGRPKTSWTRLDGDVLAGASQITVLECDGWQVGDQIVISGTTHQKPDIKLVDDGQGQLIKHVEHTDYAEVVTITNIDVNVVTFTPVLEHPHNGLNAVPMYDHDVTLHQWTPEQRAEVGMLTHNVKVEGIVSPTAPTFGGHIMMMRMENHSGGRGRFSGVELHRMGQMGHLGRYPVHWHMQVEDGDGQYFKNSSIHESFNRAVTIHGTESVRVENNVAYHHIGHGIFLEDGSERFNQIHDNLVLSTLRPEPNPEIAEYLPGVAYVPLLPSDHEHPKLEEGEGFQNRSPASFWITNPNNDITGNVAAGTEGTGYWFALPESPLGPSGEHDTLKLLSPRTEPRGTFDNNTAHSCFSGFDVNDSIDPSSEEILGNVPWLPSEPALIKGFSAWACGSGIYTGNGFGDITFEDAMLLDNSVSHEFAGYHLMDKSLIVANSGNGLFTATSSFRAAFRLYHSFPIQNSLISGFDGGPFEQNVLFINSGAANKRTDTRFAGLDFDPWPPVVFVREPLMPDFDNETGTESRHWGYAVRDEDGTLTGRAGDSIVSGQEMVQVAWPNWTNYSASLLGTFVFGSNNETMYKTPFTIGRLRLRFMDGTTGYPTSTVAPQSLKLSRLHDLGLFSPQLTDRAWASTGPQNQLQMALILDSPSSCYDDLLTFPANCQDGAALDDFKYEIDWSDEGVSKCPDEYLRLVFDGAREVSDRVFVTLTEFTSNQAPLGGLSIRDKNDVTIPSEASAGALLSKTTFGWYYNGSDLHMVFTGVPSADDAPQVGDHELEVRIDWTSGTCP